jgi:hypothetical protein
MLLSLSIISGAFAGLPDGLTPTAMEDAEPWEVRSRALLDGPDGCIQVRGRVRMQVSFYTPGGWISPGERSDLVGQGSFQGTLDHGIWTTLATTWDAPPDGLAGGLEIEQVHPIVGRLPARPMAATAAAKANGGDPDSAGTSISFSSGDGSGTLAIRDGGEAAMGLLDEIIDNIDPSITTAYVVWDEATRSVRLHQLVGLAGDQDLEIKVRFPENGPPTQLDAVFPRRVRFKEDFVRVTIRDAQLHLRGRQTAVGLVPGVEGMSLVVGAMGFTIGLDQRLSYDQVRACPK